MFDGWLLDPFVMLFFCSMILCALSVIFVRRRWLFVVVPVIAVGAGVVAQFLSIPHGGVGWFEYGADIAFFALFFNIVGVLASPYWRISYGRRRERREERLAQKIASKIKTRKIS